MAKFEVWISRPITESVLVEVEANDSGGAVEAAMLKISDDIDPPNWEIDDGPQGDLYVSSVEDVS